MRPQVDERFTEGAIEDGEGLLIQRAFLLV